MGSGRHAPRRCARAGHLDAAPAGRVFPVTQRSDPGSASSADPSLRAALLQTQEQPARGRLAQ